jgi:hypothetical protein
MNIVNYIKLLNLHTLLRKILNFVNIQNYAFITNC